MLIYKSNIKNNNPCVYEYVSTVNRYGVFHNIVKCKHCGLVYMNPRDADIKSLYEEVVDNAYLQSQDERMLLFKRHFNVFKKCAVGKSDLLDVGCYAGIFFHAIEQEGLKLTGIEPSKWAVKFSRRKNKAMIVQSTCENASFEDGSFDIITMWDVVEHLEDPSLCFAKMYKWLRKDGIIVLTTHDISSLFARILGKKYPWLMRFHFYHFNPNTLSKLLVKNKFDPLETRYYAKIFSLQYFLSQIGIKIDSPLLKKIRLSVNLGDMFMMIARKG